MYMGCLCRVILRYSWSMENDAPFYELERILGNILHSFVGLGGVVHTHSLSQGNILHSFVASFVFFQSFLL